MPLVRAQRIVLSLPVSTNGVQSVTGDISFLSATAITLDASIYTTNATYVLFTYTGSVTGLNNVTVTHSGGKTVSNLRDDSVNKKILVDVTG